MLWNLEHRRSDSYIDLFVENGRTIPRKMSEKHPNLAEVVKNY